MLTARGHQHFARAWMRSRCEGCVCCALLGAAPTPLLPTKHMESPCLPEHQLRPTPAEVTVPVRVLQTTAQAQDLAQTRQAAAFEL